MNNGILTQSAQPVAMPYGLLGRPTPVPMPAVDYAFDVDAADYIWRVEAADRQALELPVRLAFDAFVRGCKADGILNAIKASCILAGARTLAGALVPLVGTAPTNFNFVSGDYNRKTGLVGDGSTKYLVSNRASDADPQNSNHYAAFLSIVPTQAGALFSATGVAGNDPGTVLFNCNTPGSLLSTRNKTGTVTNSVEVVGTGLKGMTRSSNASYLIRSNSASITVNVASDGTGAGFSSTELYRRNINGVTGLWLNGRLAFYSIGEALDLALLDGRVTGLMNTLAAVL